MLYIYLQTGGTNDPLGCAILKKWGRTDDRYENSYHYRPSGSIFCKMCLAFTHGRVKGNPAVVAKARQTYKS